MAKPVSENLWPAETDGALPAVFLPYQQRTWEMIEANRGRLILIEKSRRIGETWAVGAIAADTGAKEKKAGGQDVIYTGYNHEMTREFIGYVGDFARMYQVAASEMQEFVFVDPDKPEEKINAFRIGFASGFEAVGLPSKPAVFRGKQGIVVLDEAAFMVNLKEMLKAALALLMWGGTVVIISTHDGQDNAFNELANDIRSGKQPGVIMRITFDDALKDGLYKRICLVTGKQWSEQAEADWRREIVTTYGEDADEELFCIANPTSGVYISAGILLATSNADIPVVRYVAKKDMAVDPQIVREATMMDWIKEFVAPILARLDPKEPCVGGMDFARKVDQSVIWIAGITSSIAIRTRLVVEMRFVPFEQQKQVLWYILEHIRLRRIVMDAGGNGAHLAEITAQKFGMNRVEQLQLTELWYRENWPPAKRGLEERTADVPLDRDIHGDFRMLRLVRGVARVPERSTSEDGNKRHGDAAIAFCLCVAASRAAPEEYAYEKASGPPAGHRWRNRAEDLDEDTLPAAGSGWVTPLRGAWNG